MKFFSSGVKGKRIEFDSSSSEGEGGGGGQLKYSSDVG